MQPEPLATINVHGPVAFAEAGGSLGAPLTIAGRRFGTGVTFFCESHALAADLADAINAVLARHAAPVALAEAA